jgi:creatine kinase
MFRNFNNYASIAAAASLVGGACLIENSDATYKVMPNLVQAQTNASFLGMNTMSRFFSSASAHCNSQFYTTESVAKMPQWIRDGLGDTPYYSVEKNATFGGKNCECPDQMPDFSKHSNFMTDFLKENPKVYHNLKNKKTKNGVNLAHCIKTGVDNPGHPHIKTCGITAGDEESYEVFAELFDPIISARHGGYGPNDTQPTNLDINKLSTTDIDPTGRYVLTSRVRTGRSISGFRLPPVIGFEERRKMEAIAVKGLMSLKGDFAGDYFPLHGSRSYAPKPNGMPESKEEELRAIGNLFQEPDSTLLLASGMGRHWPDARGVFHNNAKSLFVWVGEEDHLRIVSMQGQRSHPTPDGKNLRQVTARFISACDEVEKVMKTEGSRFMHNNHLGFVLTCPSNLGTGLRCGCMAKLPHVSGRKDFKPLLDKMKL